MDQLKLTDDEWKCYAEHFSSCDLEGSGRVPLVRATELFHTANLTAEQVAQVLQVSGAKRVGHFGRSQFYIALRCIALIQAGVAADRLSAESLRWQQFDKDAHLPKLEHRASPKADKPPATPTRTSSVSHAPPPAPPPKFVIRQTTIADPQPPKVTQKPQASALHSQHSIAVTNPSSVASASNSSTAPQSRSSNKDWASFEEADELRVSNVTASNNVANAFTAFDDSASANAPLNSQSAEQDFDDHDENDAIVQRDESEVLLGVAGAEQSGEHKFSEDWFHFSENEQANAAAANQSNRADAGHAMRTSSLEKERMYNAAVFQKRKETGKKKDSTSDSDSDVSDESTETEGDANADGNDSHDDVYKMTQEQRNYYVEHFLSLVADSNPKATLDGNAAGAFLLKSNLPVDDLKRIWQLADADCDGALTLEEFCTAMHLTVLRRNGLEIPERLELSKMPYAHLDAQALDLPDDRQPDDAYAHAQLDEPDAAAQRKHQVTNDQAAFVPDWSRHSLEPQSSVGAYSTLTDGDDDHSGYTTNTEGVQVPRPVKFSDAPPVHRVSAQPFAIRTAPPELALPGDTNVKPLFKPPPLPPRKPPVTNSSLPLASGAPSNARLHSTDQALSPPSPTEWNNDWLRNQIDKLQEIKTVQERLNRELNAELQETMEQRIALEIQLEHLLRPSLI